MSYSILNDLLDAALNAQSFRTRQAIDSKKTDDSRFQCLREQYPHFIYFSVYPFLS